MDLKLVLLLNMILFALLITSIQSENDVRVNPRVNSRRALRKRRFVCIPKEQYQANPEMYQNFIVCPDTPTGGIISRPFR